MNKRKPAVFEKNGTVYINWPVIPAMSHLGLQTLSDARKTVATDAVYKNRKKGDVPFEVTRKLRVCHEKGFKLHSKNQPKTV